MGEWEKKSEIQKKIEEKLVKRRWNSRVLRSVDLFLLAIIHERSQQLVDIHQSSLQQDNRNGQIWKREKERTTSKTIAIIYGKLWNQQKHLCVCVRNRERNRERKGQSLKGICDMKNYWRRSTENKNPKTMHSTQCSFETKLSTREKNFSTWIHGVIEVEYAAD